MEISMKQHYSSILSPEFSMLIHLKWMVENARLASPVPNPTSISIMLLNARFEATDLATPN